MSDEFSTVSAASDDMKFMQAALEAAQQSHEAGEVPVGCVFVYESPDSDSAPGSKRILASGFNATNESKNGTRHAELIAIDDILLVQKLPIDVFRTTDLYVTCEPCIMCAAAISKLGIRKVYFGCHNDRFGGNGSILSVHEDTECSQLHRYPIQTGLLKKESIDIFQQFYSKENDSAPAEKRRRKDGRGPRGGKGELP